MAILISTKDKASQTSEGLVRFATSVEANTGTRADVVMSPALVKAQLDSLLDGAPAALDTLNELAAAINDDASFFTSVSADITNLQDQIDSLSGGGASNQAEVDRIEAGVGLGSTGLYVSRSGTNYLDSASSIVGEISALDTQVKANEDAIALRATSATVSAIDVRLTSAESNITANDGDITSLDGRITTLESSASNQAEVDAIEASVGLNANGTLGSYANNNFYSASATIKAAVAGVDAQAKLNKDDVDDHETRITSLEGGGSLSALQSEVDASQAGVGLSTAGAHVARSGTNYLDTATSIVGEIGLLDAQVDTNEQDIATINTTISTLTSEGDSNGDAIDALQVELDATQAGAGLSNLGAYSAPGVSNYLSGASTLKAADSLLDTQIKTNETAIATKAASSITTAIQAEVDQIEATVGLGTDGTLGSWVNNANYSASATLKAAIEGIDEQVRLQTINITSQNTLGNLHEAAIGISTTGNYVGRSGSNYLDSASTVVGEATLLDAQVKTNETAIATKASSSTVSAIDVRVTAAEDDIDDLETLQTAQEAAIGLSTAGAHVARSGTNFINSASSIAGEITLLDTQLGTTQGDLDTAEASIVTNASNISSNDTDIATLNTLADTHESSIGLNANGSYTTVASSNFLETATTIKGSLEDLDTQLKSTQDDLDTAESTIVSHTSSLSTNAAAISTNTANISSNDTEIQALEDLADTHETSIGLDNDGGYTAISGANYASSGVSIKAAITQLDTQLKTTQDEVDAEETARASGDNTNAAAINTVEASVGLGSDGSLTISGTNFINGQSTITSALGVLDTNIALVDSIQDNIRTAAGTNATGSLTNYASTNYVTNTDSLKAAIEALDAQVKTNEDDIAGVSGGSISALQTEVDAIETAAGLASGGAYVAHSGSNYMDSASTMKAAREALDTQLKTVADDLDTAEAAIVSNDTDITALQTRATSLEQRCGGMMRNVLSDTSAVMDDSPIIRGHAGPFAYNLGASYLGGFGAGGFEFDFIFYGTTAERCSDIHFDVQSDGDAAFTGHVSAPADL